MLVNGINRETHKIYEKATHLVALFDHVGSPVFNEKDTPNLGHFPPKAEEPYRFTRRNFRLPTCKTPERGKG
jgi:hypothetical protein